MAEVHDMIKAFQKESAALSAMVEDFKAGLKAKVEAIIDNVDRKLQIEVQQRQDYMVGLLDEVRVDYTQFFL